MTYTNKWALALSVSLTLFGTQAFAENTGTTGHKVSKSSAKSTHTAHWTYNGPNGPEHWGSLDPAFGACATGTQQSPIDINSARRAALPAIEVNWKRFTPVIVNNGHTIQVNTGGKGAMVLDGKTYSLLQFHFHHDSEHTLNGRHFPLEAHFVHKAEDGTLGVLGVFFKEGTANPALQRLWDDAPLSVGEIKAKKKFKPELLLPLDRSYFRYAGSLTTPPCSEIVSWAVFGQPLEASKAQIEAFAGLYADNYRPIQNTNRRYILHTQ